MNHPRLIGHVISVYGLWLKVELSSEAISPSRATPDGTQFTTAINSYLTFDLGAGIHAIGIITELESRESHDIPHDKELTLDLSKPRRIASIQLLGALKGDGSYWKFDVGITVLPTLGTPAEIAAPGMLSCLFDSPPVRNHPLNYVEKIIDYDCGLEIGYLSGDENQKVKASFNDLFSRPLAVIGNTGSGKSYTVTTLLNGILENKKINSINSDTNIFILDINGEYAKAFLKNTKKNYERIPNRIYLNGDDYCLPAWCMNSEEVCDWLIAAESTQKPVLKDWWAMAKGNSGKESLTTSLQFAVDKIDSMLEWINSNKPKHTFDLLMKQAKERIDEHGFNFLEDIQIDWHKIGEEKWWKIENDFHVTEKLCQIRDNIADTIANHENSGVNFSQSADAPRFIAIRDFKYPKLVDRSVKFQDSDQINQYLVTLKLRLRTRLNDKRWQSFFNYDKQGICSFEKWISRLGIGTQTKERVSILDLSMLSSEVLPFACAMLGRLLLETREMLRPKDRIQHPWVLVLEEAHNYIRPSQLNEDRAQRLSRKTFERIAKEGRKFGLSLVIASQRPSEISSTIISQCANFFTHRLQNPDDIDHIRSIVPKQAHRLLDQVTVLTAGEAIVFGSATHTPLRVQINCPKKEPLSSSATPFLEWQKTEVFPLFDVLGNWGLDN